VHPSTGGSTPRRGPRTADHAPCARTPPRPAPRAGVLPAVGAALPPQAEGQLDGQVRRGAVDGRVGPYAALREVPAQRLGCRADPGVPPRIPGVHRNPVDGNVVVPGEVVVDLELQRRLHEQEQRVGPGRPPAPRRLQHLVSQSGTAEHRHRRTQLQRPFEVPCSVETATAVPVGRVVRRPRAAGDQLRAGVPGGVVVGRQEQLAPRLSGSPTDDEVRHVRNRGSKHRRR
jgi:hypothetical protein